MAQAQTQVQAQAQAQGQPTAPPPRSQAPAAAANAPPAPDDLVSSDRFRHLASELRCLVCQNQTLADSNAPLAMDLRIEVTRLMREGKSDSQIKRFLVDRYGEFVLYRPSLSGRNAVLWFGPFALLAIGALVWWRLGRGRSIADASADDALRRVDEIIGR
ncbi:MAG: cytochrome c-type biogenesis protein CcmH [Lautropia sp.]